MTLKAKFLSFALVPAALAIFAATVPASALTVGPTGSGNVCTESNYARYLSGIWPPQLNLNRCDWTPFGG